MFSKKIRIAINGFGRIGRNAFKIAFENKKLEVVAVNDLADSATLAHLLKHDTNYGEYERRVEALVGRRAVGDSNAVSGAGGIGASAGAAGALKVGDREVKVFSEKDPLRLPWGILKIDVVLECTGKFTSAEGAGAHIKAGAKKVIISAPAKNSTKNSPAKGLSKGGNVPTFVRGVNDKAYKGQAIINNASCTTNCIAPVTQVLHSKFGVKKAVMTTVHSYTADQNLQDAPHKDLRRARTAGANMVPTTTGAAIATTETIPDLKGRFDGMAVRVPTSIVSFSDITFILKRKVTVAEVNRAFKSAAAMPQYRGILAVTEEPLVSSDFIKNSFSAIVDLGLTKVVDGDLVKVIAWYDNEWGYANRLVEMATWIGGN